MDYRSELQKVTVGRKGFYNQLRTFLSSYRQEIIGRLPETRPYAELPLPVRFALDRELQARGDLIVLIEEHLLVKLARPWSFTAYDVRDLVFYQFAGVSDNEIDKAFERFDLHLQSLGCGFSSRTFEFPLGDWSASRSEWNTEDTEEHPSISYNVWDSPNGWMLDARWRPEQAEYTNGPVIGLLTAPATETAVAKFGPRIRDAANAAFKTILMVFARVTEQYPPSIDHFKSAEGKRIISEMISAHISEINPSASKQRLANAVSLLVLADQVQVSSEQASVALCAATIEALLCNSHENIANHFARRAATLLEPDRLKRPDCIKQIKSVYTDRSKLLHGDSGCKTTGEIARLLAGAVIVAYSEWQAHMAMIGHEAEREHLIKELDFASESGQEIVGVREELRRCIPSP